MLESGGGAISTEGLSPTIREHYQVFMCLVVRSGLSGLAD
jgi:hypothetical protein